MACTELHLGGPSAQGLTFVAAPPPGALAGTTSLLQYMLAGGVISQPSFTLFLIDPSNPVPLPGSTPPGKRRSATALAMGAGAHGCGQRLMMGSPVHAAGGQLGLGTAIPPAVPALSNTDVNWYV